MNRTLLAIGLILPLTVVTSVADILDSWHWRNPAPFSDTMQSICFGGGRFVAAGIGGVVHTSSDGLNWDDGQKPVLFTLNQVIYANGRFMVVGDQGTILTSTNGFNWNAQVSGVTNDLLGVTFGNGLYIACGTAGRLVISSDGNLWNTSSAGTNDLNWIAFGNGVFVLPVPPPGWESQSVQSSTTPIQISQNGLAWSAETLPAPSAPPTYAVSYQNTSLSPVAFGNGLFLTYARHQYYTFQGQFLFGTDDIQLYQSSDGTNWINGAIIPPAMTASITSLALTFANGLFYGFMAPSYITSAANSSAYAIYNAPGQITNRISMAYGSGRYVLMEDNGSCWISNDATNWMTANSGLRANFYRIIAGASNYLVLADSQPILVTSDGMHFTAASNTATAFDVAFDGTNYVAVGGYSGGLTSLIYTSTNSTDWVSRSSNAAQPLYAVCRGATQWVAVGKNGTIASSPNTLAWTLRASGTANTLNNVAFGGGSYVAVGIGGTIINSPDGASWSVQYAGTGVNLNYVRYLGSQFFAIGDGGTILTSPDGGTWSSVTSGTTAALNSIIYGNGRYVICGTGVVLASTNGVNWQDITAQVPTIPNGRSVSGLGMNQVFPDASSIAFLNQSFWLVGNNGAILQSDSTDGIPRLAGAWLPNNGGFRLKIPLNVPPQYRFQCSTNFLAWQDLVSITNGIPPAVWDDTNALKSPAGFYRVAAP